MIFKNKELQSLKYREFELRVELLQEKIKTQKMAQDNIEKVFKEFVESLE